MAETTAPVVTLTVEVSQAVKGLVAALGETPQWQAYDKAVDALQTDQAANQALEALRAKQESLSAMIALNALREEERAELQGLQRACLEQPCIAAYLQSQQDLALLSAAVVDVLSMRIGVSFAAACGTACCPPATGEGPEHDAERGLPSALVMAVDVLAEILRSAEPLSDYQRAQERFQAEATASKLWWSFTQAVNDLNGQQDSSTVDALTVERVRNLQRQVRDNRVIAEWLQRQQAASAYLKRINAEISQLLGMNFAALAAPAGCCG